MRQILKGFNDVRKKNIFLRTFRSQKFFFLRDTIPLRFRGGGGRVR